MTKMIYNMINELRVYFKQFLVLGKFKRVSGRFSDSGALAVFLDKLPIFSNNTAEVMIMKKPLTVILALVLCAAAVLSSCGKKGPADPGNQKGETAMPIETPNIYDENYEISVYPKPLAMTISENESEYANASTLTPSDRSFDDIFNRFGYKVGDGGLPVEIAIDASLDEEEYKLVTTKEAVTIKASCRRGVYTAVSTLAQITKGGKIAAADISDKPSVPIRGVIEGFYGTAWTHEYRLDLFRLMGKYKLNAYMYAPKDDPKHRAEWRSLYTGEELEKMKELIECANENNVRFIYAISPGIDINLGSKYDKDLEKLFAKCESMFGLGVRDFAILLDDITTLDAEGHAKLLNDFQNKFVKTHDGCADLVMITTEYCDAMITKYSKDIAPLIQADIKVMWTGAGVIPASITESSLKKPVKLYDRPMFIWWNYPVNDVLANNLFMGPCEGLGDTISNAINGLVSNPMNQGYASMLPLLTISDFLWNPDGYDKEASLQAAANKLAPQCADGLALFADLCRASVMNGNTSSLYLRDEIDGFTKNGASAAAPLKQKLETVKAGLAKLREKADKKLVAEINPWLTKAEGLVDAALEYLGFCAAEDAEEKLAHALAFASGYKNAFKSEAIVSADVLVPFLENAKPEINGIFGENSGSDIQAASVSTSLPTYLDYSPENAVDGNTTTFFWSAGAPSAGSYFTYDLGRQFPISGIKLTMGTDDHADDYIRKGVIEYSTDGTSYTRLCNISGRVVEDTTAFTARYVRVRCTAEQTNWLIIAGLDVIRDIDLPAGVTFDGGKNIDLSVIFDKNLFTTLDARTSSVIGRTITIDVSASSSIEFMFIDVGSVKLTLTKNDGTVENAELSPYMKLDLSSVSSLSIRFSGSFSLAEVIIN